MKKVAMFRLFGLALEDGGRVPVGFRPRFRRRKDMLVEPTMLLRHSNSSSCCS